MYHRRRVARSAWGCLVLGVLPLAAAGFPGWIVAESLRSAPAAQVWSLAGVAGAGLVLMLCARLLLRSPFFAISRESAG